MLSDGLKERFTIIRKESGLNVKQFASSLDMVSTTVSSIESGSREPSKEVLIKLAARYRVNLHWMLTGEGDRYSFPGVGIPKELKGLLTTEGIPPELRQLNNLPDTIETDNSLSKMQSFNLFKFQYGKIIPIETDEEDQNAMSLLPLYGQPASAGPGQEPNQLNTIEAYIPIVFEMLGGSSPRNCGIIRVVGDSMTDMTLFNGDLAIFDRTQLEGDGIFVISIGDAVRVKRLEYRTIEQKIIISSENAKRYPSPEILNYEQAQNILRVHGKVICWMHRHPY